MPLQGDDLVDEIVLLPRFVVAEGVAERDDVGRSLLDDLVPALPVMLWSARAPSISRPICGPRN